MSLEEDFEDDFEENFGDEFEEDQDEDKYLIIQHALALFEDDGIYDEPFIKRFDIYPKVLMGSRELDLTLAVIRYVFNHADGPQILDSIYNICCERIKCLPLV